MIEPFFKWLRRGYRSDYHKLYIEEQKQYIELLKDLRKAYEHAGEVIKLAMEVNDSNGKCLAQVGELMNQVKSLQTKLAERESQIKHLTPATSSPGHESIQN